MDDDDRVLAYVQGRLDGPDQSAFERDLAKRADLRAEIAALRATRNAFAQEEADAAPAEGGWQRLSQSITTERAPANLNRRPALAQMAAAAIGAIAIWQFLAVPFLPGGEEAGFVPVSEAPLSPAEAERALRVGFAETASVGALTALLAEAGARIVDGPSAVGLFTLSFDDAAAREAAEAIFAARGALVLVVSRP